MLDEVHCRGGSFQTWEHLVCVIWTVKYTQGQINQAVSKQGQEWAGKRLCSSLLLIFSLGFNCISQKYYTLGDLISEHSWGTSAVLDPNTQPWGAGSNWMLQVTPLNGFVSWEPIYVAQWKFGSCLSLPHGWLGTTLSSHNTPVLIVAFFSFI